MNTAPQFSSTAEPGNQGEKIRILRIINRFNLGGPSYNAAYLTKYLPDKFEIMLVGGTPLPEEAHSGFIMDKLGVKYLEINEMGRRVRLWDDWKAYRRLSKLIKTYRPHIVHTHAAKAGALGRIAARMHGVPVIVHTFHGHVFSSYFTGMKAYLVKWIERRLASISSAIVTISKQQFEELTSVYRICSPSRTHIIPLGFDLSRFAVDNDRRRQEFRRSHGLTDTDLAIGIVGRFAPVKNHHFFIDVIKALRKRHPDLSVKAVIVGDGDARTELKNACAPYSTGTGQDGTASDFIFTSWIKDIESFLPAMDLVVLTSLNEGTPVSLIEAQAAGVPVMSSDVGGVRDCILDGQTGIVMPQFDAMQWADRIAALARDTEKRTQMGHAGQKFAPDAYGYANMVRSMEALYLQLLAKRQR
ncbi:MAG: glycosyltransferase [Flavobacteriales bacterium]|nr:glycosyltransferase [Flavobacteriales bacterium]